MRLEIGLVVVKRNEEEEVEGGLAVGESLAAALRTEADRKNDLAAAAPAILIVRLRLDL